MTSITRMKWLRCVGLMVCCLWSAAVCRADSLLLNLSFNTSSLVGHAAGPFSLNFQLTNGDIAANSVTISDFVFGGGAPAGSPTLLGGASGSLATQVALSDSAFLNDFVQEFIPGNVLGFRLTLTPPAFSGGVPDQFTFAILDSAFQEVLTTDPLGTNVLLRVEINSANPEVEQFALSARPIPEPATMLLLGTGLAAVITSARRRRDAAQNEEG